MYRKKSIYKNQYYLWLQASTEGLGTHPSWIRGDYCTWEEGLLKGMYRCTPDVEKGYCILPCIMYLHVLYAVYTGYPWYVIIIPMYNAHPYFSLKNWGQPWLVWLSGLSAGLFKGVSSIPSQCTCLDCRLGPQKGAFERQIHIDVSLPFSIPSPVSKNE